MGPRTPADQRPRPKAPRRPGRVTEDLWGFRRGAEKPAPRSRCMLRLYVTGVTPTSSRAIQRVRKACEEHLQGRYELEVIDIHQLPRLAKDEQIIATPTLIRVLPSPLRRFIGDLSRVEKVLFGMDLREKR